MCCKTNRFNYWCFGLQPVWFHATNVLLHALVSVLFTRVALRIAAMKPPFATVAGLLFAVHPIHTEAVTGIVGRADVLACVFFLLSLLAYHGNAADGCSVWRSVALGGLSMMSKETGVTVFLLNLGLDSYKNYPSIKRTLIELRWNKETQDFMERAVKVFISLGVLLTVRLALLQGSLPKFSQQDNPAAFHSSLYVRVLTFCYLAAFNWWLLLCPVTMSHDWQMGSVPLVTSIYDSRNLITFFFFMLTFLLVFKSVCDLEHQKHVPVAVGLALLVLPFLPATNLFVTVGFVIAERVLYIPSMGCILLVIYAAQMIWVSFPKHRQTLLFFVMLMITSSCLRTIVRNRDWCSRETLLRAGLMTLPQNAKMHYNYANFLRDSARPELAKSHYHKALKLWPTYASAHNNLGTLLSNEQEAEQHFLAAIRYSSDHVNAHYNLGQLYRKSNRSESSEKMLKRCLDIEPSFTPAYLELARLRGPTDRSVGSLLKQVMILNIDDPYYGTLYGNWLSSKGNYGAALNIYWNVLQRSDSHLEAFLRVARILRRSGQKSRLLQTITRWHAILRQRRGGVPLNPHVYLQGWQLKKELNRKAKVYDNCSSIEFRTQYTEPSTKENHSNNDNRWSQPDKNSSEKFQFTLKGQCESEKNKIEKQGPTTPMMVHHLLDSV